MILTGVRDPGSFFNNTLMFMGSEQILHKYSGSWGITIFPVVLVKKLSTT